jgi:pre-60S factor REI1
MAHTSHCKLAYEDDIDMEEYEDFYDFSSTFEDVSDDALSESDEEEERVADISATTGELILPDGKFLGHRDLRKYYRQYSTLMISIL